MNIVFLLIPLGMGLMVAAVVALFWAVNSGQYDDLEDAGNTVLDSEDRLAPGAAADKNRAFCRQSAE
jgi:cbb3-type cytochrome oxidase maturation protein